MSTARRLEELVARVICPRYPLARDGLDFGDGGPRPLPGGFCVFRDTLPAALDDLADARGEGRFPYVCADFERGVGHRVPGAVRLPPPWAIGATGDVALARAAGRATSLEALDRGIAVVFAPVLDVADEPENPIVGTRAFAATAEEVARFGAAWVEGALAGGAIPVGKHYPGHGATRVDSHLALPTIERDADALARVEEVPFRAAIAAGLPAIMVGHLHVPALDPTPGVPSTLSPPTVAGRLRAGLGFADGLVFTDALDMGAIASRTGGPETEPAVRALLAGVDVPLLPDDPHRAARAIRDAVTSGRLPRARLEEAVRRIESRVAGPAVRTPIARTSREETAALAREIARRSVVRSAAAPPPALAGERVALSLLDDSADGEAAGGLRARLGHAGMEFADEDEAALPLVVVLADVRDHKGRVGLPDEARARLERAVARRPDAELLIVGPPGAVPPAARPLRTTHVFGTDRASLDAAAEVLTGRLAAEGHADWSR